MKTKRSKIIIGFIIFILFISLTNSCTKNNKDNPNDITSETVETEDNDSCDESSSDNDNNTEIKENTTTTSKSINDYPDFLNIIDKSHSASKIAIDSSKFHSPKSICETENYYLILSDNSIHAYSKETGEVKHTPSLIFINKDYKEENSKKDKNTEQTRDYNKDTIDAICTSENNLWVCHSSNKTSTITKFNLSSIISSGKLSSEYSFNLKSKCNFITYNDGILWTGQNKSHGACVVYGYPVQDNKKDFLKKDPRYRYSFRIPNNIDGMAINNNRFLFHENSYKSDDSHIYIFDNVDIKNSDLNDITTSSKTITLPKRRACINYSKYRLIILFNNHGVKPETNIIDHLCPLII